MVKNSTSSTLYIINQTQFEDDTIGKGLQTNILGNVVTAVLSFVALYVLISLTVYQCFSKTPFTIVVGCHLTSAVAGVLSLASEQIELQLGDYSSELCSLYTKLVACFYFIGILSTFTLIWFRQKFLYSDPLLRSYNGRCWRFFSNFIIVGIYVVFITAGCILVSYLKLNATKNGCILSLEDEDLTIVSSTVVALGVCGVLFQLSLLLLIIYPLQKTDNLPKPDPSPLKISLNRPQTEETGEMWNDSSRKSSSSNYLNLEDNRMGQNANQNRGSVSSKRRTSKMEESAQTPKSTQKSLTMLIRRLIACTAVCIVSELVSGAIAVISILFAPDSYWSLVMHSDLVINTIATTCAFVNWRERLFPWTKISSLSVEKT